MIFELFGALSETSSYVLRTRTTLEDARAWLRTASSHAEGLGADEDVQQRLSSSAAALQAAALTLSELDAAIEKKLSDELADLTARNGVSS